MRPTTKHSSYNAVSNAVSEATRIILDTTDKRAIVEAFKDLQCIVTGTCICDTCDTWDQYAVSYEFARCLVPTRFMQLAKERHHGTHRWTFVGPLYKELFSTLYADIDPESGILHSGGDDIENDHPCSKSQQPLAKRASILVSHPHTKPTSRTPKGIPL